MFQNEQTEQTAVLRQLKELERNIQETGFAMPPESLNILSASVTLSIVASIH